MLISFSANFYTIFFSFLLFSLACGILVTQPGIKPGDPAVIVPSLNHWTIREFPWFTFLWKFRVYKTICFAYSLIWSWHGEMWQVLFSPLMEALDSWEGSLYPHKGRESGRRTLRQSGSACSQNHWEDKSWAKSEKEYEFSASVNGTR